MHTLFGDKDLSELMMGAGTTFYLKIIGFVLSIILNIIIARVYGAHAMGILAVSTSVLSFITIISLFGSRSATIRTIARYADTGKHFVKQIYRKTLALTSPIAVLFGFGLFFASAWMSEYLFHKPELTPALRLFAIAVPLRTINIINIASLQGLKKIGNAFFSKTVLPQLSNIIIIGLLFLLTAKTDMVPVYAHAFGILSVTVVTVYFWQYHSSTLTNTIKLNEKDALTDDYKFKDILSLSLPMFFSSSMLLIMGTADTLILGIYSPTHEIGIYRAVLKLALPINFILIAINSIATPKFAELYFQGKNEELKRVAQFASKISFLLSLPVVIVFILFAKPMLSAFGDQFVIGSIALVILSMGRLISTYCGSNAPFFNMTDNHKLLGYIMFWATVVNIALNFILIPIYGMNGAAIATVASMALWNITASVAIYKKFGYWINYIPQIRTGKF
jgi:O-antigen/teichoic acid export membrane protein